MPPVHHHTFKLADMPQARLLVLADEIDQQIKDPKYVTNVDSTGHLIAAASQLLGQAEFAELLNSEETLNYSKQVVSIANGVQNAQVNARVTDEPAEAVIKVNREIMGVLRGVLNKVSALKTQLALQQLEASITKMEGASK